MKRLLILAGLAAAVLAPSAAPAQNKAGVLVLYGNDKCPTDREGNEIVVCTRRPEADRFRIPPELRAPAEVAPQRESWAVRQQEAMSTGATGPGSCSTVGPGGMTGCLIRETTQAKKEYRQRKQEMTDLPLP
jgi:hypothetical protein